MELTHWLTSFCLLRDPSSEEHLLPASPSEREIAVPVSPVFQRAGSVPPLTPPPPADSLSLTASTLSPNRRWTALCFCWPATSSTAAPTPGYAPITSAWSTSEAPIRWSRTRPWSSSPSQTGRREVWKQCEESKQEKVIVSLRRFNNYTIFHELNQTQMSLTLETTVWCGLGLWKKLQVL